MSLANNARDMLEQVDHALARIADGSYGVCESCGKPIGKYRLQAFPRATLCRTCKEAEERFLSTGGHGRRLAKCFEAPIDQCSRCLRALPWASSL